LVSGLANSGGPASAEWDVADFFGADFLAAVLRGAFAAGDRQDAEEPKRQPIAPCPGEPERDRHGERDDCGPRATHTADVDRRSNRSVAGTPASRSMREGT